MCISKKIKKTTSVNRLVWYEQLLIENILTSFHKYDEIHFPCFYLHPTQVGQATHILFLYISLSLTISSFILHILISSIITTLGLHVSRFRSILILNIYLNIYFFFRHVKTNSVYSFSFSRLFSLHQNFLSYIHS